MGIRMPGIIPRVQRRFVCIAWCRLPISLFISWRSWLISVSTWFSLVSKAANLWITCSRIPSTLATRSSKFGFAEKLSDFSGCSQYIVSGDISPLGEVFHSKAKITQDSSQSAFGNITSGLGDGSKASVLRVPPDFVRARPLFNKLTAQLMKFPGQHAVGHTGTTSSA